MYLQKKLATTEAKNIFYVSEKRMKSFLRKIKHYVERKMKFYRRFGLKNKSVAVISNNCTGGYVYQYFGLEYCSPTAGLFLTGEDYVKLCTDLKGYFSKGLVFISSENSKNKAMLCGSHNWGNYPVAYLGDIEVYFMHYRSKEEAEQKWKRRISRVDFNNLMLMFAESDMSTPTDIAAFCELPTKNKICLSYRDYGTKTIFCQRVADMEIPSWHPDIVLSSVCWKEIINEVLKKDER